MTKRRKPIGRPRGTGTQRVYSHVREKILRLDLDPGADLDEARLEQEFGISRTPVREALIRLASEGLVTLMPNRGARVMPLELTDVPQLLEGLELYHRVIMRWAAARRQDSDLEAMRHHNQSFVAAAEAGDYDRMSEANKAFHVAIAQASGNKYLAQAFEAMQTVSLRLARLSFANSRSDSNGPEYSIAEIIKDHEKMIQTIEAQDAEAADRLACKHMQIFRRRVSRFVQSSLASEVPIEAAEG